MKSSTCAQIQENAAGLMSLGRGDAERRAASTHAATCAECAAALAEAGAVMALIDGARPVAPRAEALAHVRLGIMDEIARDAARIPSVAARPESTGPDALVLGALGAVLGASWLISMFKHLPGGGTATVHSGALALVAAAGALASLRWGPRWIATLPAAALVFALAGGRGGGLQASQGLECALFETALALAPLVVTIVLARRDRRGPPILAVAAAAGAGALVGEAVLQVACHAIPGVAHGLVFHAGPVVIVLALGALLGRAAGAHERAS